MGCSFPCEISSHVPFVEARVHCASPICGSQVRLRAWIAYCTSCIDAFSRDSFATKRTTKKAVLASASLSWRRTRIGNWQSRKYETHDSEGWDLRELFLWFNYWSMWCIFVRVFLPRAPSTAVSLCYLDSRYALVNSFRNADCPCTRT